MTHITSPSRSSCGWFGSKVSIERKADSPNTYLIYTRPSLLGFFGLNQKARRSERFENLVTCLAEQTGKTVEEIKKDLKVGDSSLSLDNTSDLIVDGKTFSFARETDARETGLTFFEDATFLYGADPFVPDDHFEDYSDDELTGLEEEVPCPEIEYDDDSAEFSTDDTSDSDIEDGDRGGIVQEANDPIMNEADKKIQEISYKGSCHQLRGFLFGASNNEHFQIIRDHFKKEKPQIIESFERDFKSTLGTTPHTLMLNTDVPLVAEQSTLASLFDEKNQESSYEHLDTASQRYILTFFTQSKSPSNREGDLGQ